MNTELLNYLLYIAPALLFVLMTVGLPARQCTGTSKITGERCKRAPIPGGTVCKMHGGATPLVQHEARLRLLAGADYAIEYLVRTLEPRPPCAECGRTDADRDPVVVRAAQIVLDRAGFGPHASLSVSRESSTELPEYGPWLTDDELEQISALIEKAKARMEAGERRCDSLLNQSVFDARVIGVATVAGEDDPEDGIEI